MNENRRTTASYEWDVSWATLECVARRMIVQILVIVHPAGQLDHPSQSRYWTEVPSLPTCMRAGSTLEEAVHDTRVAIAAAQQRRIGKPDWTNHVGLPDVDVQLAL